MYICIYTYTHMHISLYLSISLSLSIYIYIYTHIHIRHGAPPRQLELGHEVHEGDQRVHHADHLRPPEGEPGQLLVHRRVRLQQQRPLARGQGDGAQLQVLLQRDLDGGQLRDSAVQGAPGAQRQEPRLQGGLVLQAGRDLHSGLRGELRAQCPLLPLQRDHGARVSRPHGLRVPKAAERCRRGGHRERAAAGDRDPAAVHERGLQLPRHRDGLEAKYN